MADDKNPSAGTQPDETQNPPADTTPDTAPEDDDSAEAPTVCADGDDEDPENCVGDALKDPWDDEFQTDWPQNEVTSE